MDDFIKGWPVNLRPYSEKKASCSLKAGPQTTGPRGLTLILLDMVDTEPLLPSFPSEFADLARSVSVPIAAGERLYSRHDFRPFFEGRALDVAQPDVRVNCVVMKTSSGFF